MWLQYVCMHPRAWRATVQAAAMGAVGSAESSVSVLVPPPPAEEFRCDVCGQSHATHKALRSHLFAAHKVRNPMRAYAFESHCMACLKEFWTRRRLLHHWATAPKCGELVRSSVKPASPSLLSGFDEEDANCHVEKGAIPKAFTPAGKPCMRLAGPLPHWAC